MSKWSSAFRDSRWQKLRLEVMERDGWKCRRCGKKEGVTLNVHHAYYEAGKAPWEYPKQTLVTFCEECHAFRHKQQTDLLVKLSNLDCSDFIDAVYAVQYEHKMCGRIFGMLMGGELKIESLNAFLDAIDIAYKAGVDQSTEEGAE